MTNSISENMSIASGRFRIAGASLLLAIGFISLISSIEEADYILTALAVVFTLVGCFVMTIRVRVSQEYLIVSSHIKRKPLKQLRLRQCEVHYIIPRKLGFLCIAMIHSPEGSYVLTGMITHYSHLLDVIESKCSE